MPPQTQSTPVDAKQKPPTPHEQDIVAVTNVDVNCNQTTSYTVERSIPVAPQAGERNPMDIPRHQSQQQEGSFEHSEYFEVRYNGQPFRIKPGETKQFPRYIAEHFAKHLADHMLQKMEDEEAVKAKAEGRSPRQGLVQSNVERPKMLDSILKTEVYFLEGAQQDQQMQAVDNGAPATDIGEVPNYALGKLQPEPKTAEQILADAGETVSPGPVVEAPGIGAQVSPPAIVDPAPPEPATTAPAAPTDGSGLPLGPDSLNNPPETPTPPVDPPKGEATKSDLIREAVLLNIPVTGRESVEELRQKIASF